MYIIMICSSVPFALSGLKAVIFYLCIEHKRHIAILFKFVLFPTNNIANWSSKSLEYTRVLKTDFNLMKSTPERLSHYIFESPSILKRYTKKV